jgi:hypothetical protein
MVDKNSNRCSIEKIKADNSPNSFSDENASRFSTVMNIMSTEHNQIQESKNLDYIDFQSFLYSKNLAFQFAPIFGTIKNINILSATMIEEEGNPQIVEQNLNSNILNNYSSYLSSPKVQVNLQSNLTDTLYNEDLLSSAFFSHIEE